VKYVTCTPVSGAVMVAGTVQTSATIAVAATTSALRGGGDGLEWAGLGVLGLLGWRSRRRTARLLVLLLAMVAAAGLSGCGSGAAATTNNRPTGSQTVVYTVTEGALTSSTSITVNIQ
jgi:hypothetical protein